MSIAFKARFSVGHFQINFDRNAGIDYFAVDDDKIDWRFFFEIIGRIADDVFADFALFKGFIIHEDHFVAFGIQILSLAIGEVGFVDFIGAFESVFDNGAVFQVTKLRAQDGAAAALLGMFDVDGFMWGAMELHDGTDFDV